MVAGGITFWFPSTYIYIYGFIHKLLLALIVPDLYIGDTCSSLSH